MKVFTNGCFDILHRGHVELLRYCSELASCPVTNHDDAACRNVRGRVIVGLNSDESVRKLKVASPQRPIFKMEDRKCLLESLKFVDEVRVFGEDTPYELIKELSPDLIVKGGDYKPSEVVGNDICRVEIFPFFGEYSTTSILNIS